MTKNVSFFNESGGQVSNQRRKLPPLDFRATCYAEGGPRTMTPNSHLLSMVKPISRDIKASLTTTELREICEDDPPKQPSEQFRQIRAEIGSNQMVGLMVFGKFKSRVRARKEKEEAERKRLENLRSARERGWRIIRETFHELLEERKKKSTRAQWGLLRKGLGAMARTDRARGTIYNKYGVVQNRRPTVNPMSMQGDVSNETWSKFMDEQKRKQKVKQQLVEREKERERIRQFDEQRKRRKSRAVVVKQEEDKKDS